MMEQRVAITGIGAVSPLGNTALATWAAMCAGTCGIGPITHFDTDAFAVKVQHLKSPAGAINAFPHARQSA
ncbi:MAG: beta-ketoacyl synthase N-terminal-like domain-containing protein [Collinsella sp.]